MELIFEIFNTSALICASYKGNAAIVEELLRNKDIDVNVKNILKSIIFK